MKNPKDKSKLGVNPTPDQLAGIPFSIDEDQNAEPHGKPDGHRNRKPAKKHDNGARLPKRYGPPTADDLAGIPISVEDQEDLTARPRKHRK
jgi:hypothetical protein